MQLFFPHAYAEPNLGEDFEYTWWSIAVLAKYWQVTINPVTKSFDRLRQHKIVKQQIKTHYLITAGFMPYEAELEGIDCYC